MHKTRSDISYAINQLCQYMHQPRIPHWQAMKRVLCYLKGTVNLDYFIHHLLYNYILTVNRIGQAIQTTEDLLAAMEFFLGNNLVSWSSKKQTMVSHSSIEAEYHLMALATTELYWLRMLFNELVIGMFHIPTIWCDNIGAIALALNPVFHARTKHVEVDYHFIREKVCNNEIKFQHVSTIDQIADVFTKGQIAQRFQYLKGKLMVCPHPINLRGVLEKIQEQLLHQILTLSVLLQIQMIQLCVTLSCNCASMLITYFSHIYRKLYGSFEKAKDISCVGHSILYFFLTLLQ